MADQEMAREGDVHAAVDPGEVELPVEPGPHRGWHGVIGLVWLLVVLVLASGAYSGRSSVADDLLPWAGEGAFTIPGADPDGERWAIWVEVAAEDEGPLPRPSIAASRADGTAVSLDDADGPSYWLDGAPPRRGQPLHLVSVGTGEVQLAAEPTDPRILGFRVGLAEPPVWQVLLPKVLVATAVATVAFAVLASVRTVTRWRAVARWRSQGGG